MKAKYILYGMILVLSNTFLFAGTHRPDVPDTKFVEYGAKFGCVMPVTTMIEDNITGIGSCVVISEHWCITAAHVTYNAKDVYVLINGSKFHIDKVRSKRQTLVSFSDEKTEDTAEGYEIVAYLFCDQIRKNQLK